MAAKLRIRFWLLIILNQNSFRALLGPGIAGNRTKFGAIVFTLRAFALARASKVKLDVPPAGMSGSNWLKPTWGVGFSQPSLRLRRLAFRRGGRNVCQPDLHWSIGGQAYVSSSTKKVRVHGTRRSPDTQADSDGRDHCSRNASGETETKARFTACELF